MKVKEPCGYHVLVKQDKLFERDDTYKRAKALGIHLEHSETKREQYSVDTGTVVQIGPLAWKDHGDGTPWAKVGDKVAFAKHAGKAFPDPDDPESFYIVFVDSDIIAVMED